MTIEQYQACVDIKPPAEAEQQRKSRLQLHAKCFSDYVSGIARARGAIPVKVRKQRRCCPHVCSTNTRLSVRSVVEHLRTNVHQHLKTLPEDLVANLHVAMVFRSVYRKSVEWRAALPFKLLGANSEFMSAATALWCHCVIIDAPRPHGMHPPGGPDLRLRLERHPVIAIDSPHRPFSMSLHLLT